MAFTNPLVATVADAGSNPLQGLTVTFTAPASGASGKFSNGTNTINVVTDSSGHATASFTANSTSDGPYNVTASVESLTTSPAFSLTNTAAACGINWKGTAGDNQ